jgi:hypothetical protein
VCNFYSSLVDEAFFSLQTNFQNILLDRSCWMTVLFSLHPPVNISVDCRITHGFFFLIQIESVDRHSLDIKYDNRDLFSWDYCLIQVHLPQINWWLLEGKTIKTPKSVEDHVSRSLEGQHAPKSGEHFVRWQSTSVSNCRSLWHHLHR